MPSDPVEETEFCSQALLQAFNKHSMKKISAFIIIPLLCFIIAGSLLNSGSCDGPIDHIFNSRDKTGCEDYTYSSVFGLENRRELGAKALVLMLLIVAFYYALYRLYAYSVSKDNLTVFDEFAAEYDQWFEQHPVEYEQELAAIKQLLPATGKGVEIGAGTARFTQALGLSLGIEPSAAMREIASSRGANMLAGTVESLPLEGGSYDYALLVTVDCFIKDLSVAFKEVFRILKPDGFIIIGLIDKDSKPGKKHQAQKPKSRFYKEANFHAIHEIEVALQESGFNKTKYVQALLPGDLNEGQQLQVTPGYGQGSFVAMRAQKLPTQHDSPHGTDTR